MAIFNWSEGNPAPTFGNARSNQLGMAWEQANLKRRGDVHSAEEAAMASIFGSKQQMHRQNMMGEQGMAEQGLKGRQAMEQQQLAGSQAVRVAGLHAGTEMRGQDIQKKLGMGQLRSAETARMTGGGGMEGGGTGIQNVAWENSKKRYDAFIEATGGYDKDTGKEFTPEQKDSMLKSFYSQEMGFFGNR